MLPESAEAVVREQRAGRGVEASATAPAGQATFIRQMQGKGMSDAAVSLLLQLAKAADL